MVVSMDRWKGKVAVVTGASAGIGAAIVEHLVDAGLKLAAIDRVVTTINFVNMVGVENNPLEDCFEVVGVARRKERVEELAKKLQGKTGKLYAVKADISKEEDVLQAFKWIKDNVGPVNILVNNAGIVRENNLIEGDTQKWKEILDTNVLGLCVATREAVKDMRANNVDGHIVHINSITGHSIPNFPGMNIYPASKHAVTALTETLRQELNSIGSKIKITSVSPGAVTTEIMEASGRVLTPEFEALLKEIPYLKSEDIADSVLYVLSTPPHVQVHELTIKPVGEKF